MLLPDPYPEKQIINVGGSAEDPRERDLSNFSPHSFRFRGFDLTNAEAFIQGIKYPEASQMRTDIFQLPAHKAKRKSPRVPPEVIEWEGVSLPYRSYQHFRLQAAAIFSKFAQNPDARQSLLATGTLPLIHDLGYPERPTTALPAAIFTRILEETRTYFARHCGAVTLAAVGIIEPTYITPGLIDYAAEDIALPSNLFQEKP